MAGSLPRNRGNRSTNRIASNVSRRLRNAGFNIAPASWRHNRQCATVRAAGDLVSVLFDHGVPGRNEYLAHQAWFMVGSWPQVSRAKVEPTEDGAVYVRFTYTPGGAPK